MVKVTAIIPSYNHANLVRRAVESALKEGCAVVVVDDCSADDVPGALKGLDCQIVRHDVNRGLASARNTGINLAATEWILPLDADDELIPGAVAGLLAVEDEADVIYGNLVYRQDRTVLRPNRDIRPEHFLSGNQLAGCSLYRKSFWEKVGGYDEERREYFEDWLYWGKLAKAGARFRWVDVNVYEYLGPPDGMCARLSRNLEENKGYVISRLKDYDGTPRSLPSRLQRGAADRPGDTTMEAAGR